MAFLGIERPQRNTQLTIQSVLPDNLIGSWQNVNLTLTPHISFQRNADVMATVAAMPQNVNESTDVHNMLSVTWPK